MTKVYNLVEPSNIKFKNSKYIFKFHYVGDKPCLNDLHETFKSGFCGYCRNYYQKNNLITNYLLNQCFYRKKYLLETDLDELYFNQVNVMKEYYVLSEKINKYHILNLLILPPGEIKVFLNDKVIISNPTTWKLLIVPYFANIKLIPETLNYIFYLHHYQVNRDFYVNEYLEYCDKPEDLKNKQTIMDIKNLKTILEETRSKLLNDKLPIIKFIQSYLKENNDNEFCIVLNKKYDEPFKLEGEDLVIYKQLFELFEDLEVRLFNVECSYFKDEEYFNKYILDDLNDASFQLFDAEEEGYSIEELLEFEDFYDNDFDLGKVFVTKEPKDYILGENDYQVISRVTILKGRFSDFH